MTFAALIARNVTRQRARTVLTVIGIAIGVTTVVALGSITSGLRATSTQMTRANGADFMVAQKGASDLSFSTLSEGDLAVVRQVAGVEHAWGVLLLISKVGVQPYFITFGTDPDELPRLGLDLTAGRLPRAEDEIALGSSGASTHGVTVGDTLTIERRGFRVVGVYRSPIQYEANGGYALLATIRALAQKPGALTVVYVRAAPGADLQALKARVEARSDRLVTISNADEYGKVDQGIEMIDAANIAISVLAVLIGAIGVMNTMIMSVFERTREIGILRAVGWRSSRILRMIIGESLLLCLVAAVVGIALGVLATRACCSSRRSSRSSSRSTRPACSCGPSSSASAWGSPARSTRRSVPCGSRRWRRCAMSEAATIDVAGVVKSYDEGRIRALDGMELQVAAGEYVAIVGPSGCGKSTLAAPDRGARPAGPGTIVVAGHDLAHEHDLSHYRARHVGIVFQLHNLLPTLTALENVQMPMFELGIRATERERAHAAARARRHGRA